MRRRAAKATCDFALNASFIVGLPQKQSARMPRSEGVVRCHRCGLSAFTSRRSQMAAAFFNALGDLSKAVRAMRLLRQNGATVLEADTLEIASLSQAIAFECCRSRPENGRTRLHA
jgi:hypothetical protein